MSARKERRGVEGVDDPTAVAGRVAVEDDASDSVWSMTRKTFPVAEWSVEVSPGRDKVGTRASWLSSEKVAPCLASAVLVP